MCMVMAALGTIGVAAWAALLDARGHQVEANLTALNRRIVFNNSRALAYRALYANHLHSDTGVAADTVYTLPESLGQATIRTYTPVPIQQSLQVRHSNNGATPTRSFATDLTVDLSDGTGAHSWAFQLRNYNPVLGGELLSMHPPVDFSSSDTLVAGTLLVRGRAAFWDAVQNDFSAGIRADEFLLPYDILSSTTFTTPSNSATLPLNYPFPLQTTGIATAGPAYAGELSITRSAANQHNDHVTRFLSTGTALELDGNTATSIGPGAPNRADGSNDTTLETQIATQSPAFLMTELPIYYPLSSRILKSVAEKNNPPFSEDQIYDIFQAHMPIHNDALTHLMGLYQLRIGSRTDELNRENGTWVSVSGNGIARVYLDSPSLPHLIFDQVLELWLVGQVDSTTAATAADLSPTGVIVANSLGFGLSTVHFEGENARRLVLGISTEGVAPTAPASYNPDFIFTSPSPFPDWHVIIDLQNTGAQVDTSAVAGATLIGGIRANRKLDVVSGTLTLEREYKHLGYESLLSRNAWIEAYSQ